MSIPLSEPNEFSRRTTFGGGTSSPNLSGTRVSDMSKFSLGVTESNVKIRIVCLGEILVPGMVFSSLVHVRRFDFSFRRHHLATVL